MHRQHAPAFARPRHGVNRVQHLAQIHLRLPAALGRPEQQRPDLLPLGIRQVRRVAAALLKRDLPRTVLLGPHPANLPAKPRSFRCYIYLWNVRACVYAPELPFTSYGGFLLRDEIGTSTAYLNGLSDPTYSEVGALLKKLPLTERLNANQRADVLQRVYGEVACDPDADPDPDADGNPFIIGQHPKCPVVPRPQCDPGMRPFP